LKNPNPTLSNQPRTPHKRPLRMGLVLLIVTVAVFAIAAWFLLPSYFLRPYSNHAEEVARPLEAALVKAGGVKTTSGGDAGRGPDNTQPHYSASYELSIEKTEAIKLITKVASDNGYNLSHASLTNRGPVPVAEQYIDNWFYDTVGKPSPYKDLQPGKINLFFVLNNDGPSDANTTAVSIRVDLPGFKQ